MQHAPAPTSRQAQMKLLMRGKASEGREAVHLTSCHAARVRARSRFACLPVCLSACLPVCLFALFACLPIHPPTHRFTANKEINIHQCLQRRAPVSIWAGT
ncbi:hypothetical protein PZA11_003949 [Diplocarpon coronariae]